MLRALLAVLVARLRWVRRVQAQASSIAHGPGTGPSTRPASATTSIRRRWPCSRTERSSQLAPRRRAPALARSGRTRSSCCATTPTAPSTRGSGATGSCARGGPPLYTGLGCPVRPIDSLGSVHVQPDGSILAVGNMSGDVVVCATTRRGISTTRSTRTGSPFFSGFLGVVPKGALRSDGKLVVADFGGILRLLPTCAPDSGFGSGGQPGFVPERVRSRAERIRGRRDVRQRLLSCAVHREDQAVDVRRSAEPGLGSGGVVILTNPETIRVTALTFDAAGCLLVEGTARRHRSASCSASPHPVRRTARSASAARSPCRHSCSGPGRTRPRA